MDTHIIKATLSEKERAFASMEFEPWPKDAGQKPPTKAQWAAIAPQIILPIWWAHAVMFKTKDELIDLLSTMPEETARQMVEGIDGAIEILKPMLDIAEAAHARLMCAGLNLPETSE